MPSVPGGDPASAARSSHSAIAVSSRRGTQASAPRRSRSRAQMPVQLLFSDSTHAWHSSPGLASEQAAYVCGCHRTTRDQSGVHEFVAVAHETSATGPRRVKHAARTYFRRAGRASL